MIIWFLVLLTTFLLSLISMKDMLTGDKSHANRILAPILWLLLILFENVIQTIYGADFTPFMTTFFKIVTILLFWYRMGMISAYMSTYAKTIKMLHSKEDWIKQGMKDIETLSVFSYLDDKKTIDKICKQLEKLLYICMYYDIPEYRLDNIFSNDLGAFIEFMTEYFKIKQNNEVLGVPSGIQAKFERNCSIFYSKIEHKIKEFETAVNQGEIEKISSHEFFVASDMFQAGIEPIDSELSDANFDSVDAELIQAEIDADAKLEELCNQSKAPDEKKEDDTSDSGQGSTMQV